MTGGSLGVSTATPFPSIIIMKNIAIVYFSGSGHTALMAEAVKSGAGSVAGVDVTLIPIEGKDIVEGRYTNNEVLTQLTAADAIIFGTPTYMAGPSAQFKAFADATGMIWFQRGWRNKIAGGFTHSGSPSGDKVVTLNYLSALAAQQAMIWVNFPEIPSFNFGKDDGLNRFGFYTGAAGATPMNPGAPAKVDAGDLLTAETYGRHLAEVTLRFNSAPAQV